MEYEAVIGLETHVQLKTKSKMWCGCANQYGAEPNTNVCPVCLGMPGVLPVPNEEALRKTVLTGYLLNCEIPRYAKFDRKNYFYPDASKNYQLTQYDKPSTANGFVEFELNGKLEKVRITRAHLEEDVGKLTHFDRTSGVDFNRAGVPLLEIVSEPDLTSADMAYAYLNALTEILHQGGVSDCDMEKGMVRCDVNISVRPVGSKELGAKIEIKNMNSFSGARAALQYEISRQIEVLKSGGKLIQSTRRWDDAAGITEQMRTKEDAHDYRYFPEPDMMPLAPTDAWLAEVKANIIELPLARKQRFMKQYGLAEYLGEVFKRNLKLAEYYEKVAKLAKDPETVAHLLLNELVALGFESRNFTEKNFADLADIFFERKINGFGVKEVLLDMHGSGKDPSVIVQERGLALMDNSVVIENFCSEVISKNPNSVNDYKSGKVAALNFLKGQVMKLSKGKANTAKVGEILERKLR